MTRKTARPGLLIGSYFESAVVSSAISYREQRMAVLTYTPAKVSVTLMSAVGVLRIGSAELPSVLPGDAECLYDGDFIRATRPVDHLVVAAESPSWLPRRSRPERRHD
jgi:hypothetical protein